MKQILVIDDDVDICNLLASYLSKNGFKVTTSFSGKSGLDSVSKNLPDVVLCDFRLNDMTGSDVLEKIKEKNANYWFSLRKTSIFRKEN